LVRDLAAGGGRPSPAGSSPSRPRRPGGPLDLSRTVARSLRTVRFRDDGSPQLAPDRLVFRTRARRSLDWRVVLVVDVSGSMEASVVYRALDAATWEWQNARTMRDDIVAYMWRSGLVRQSVEAAMPLIPRWERYLRSVGIDAVPRRPGQGPARAENLLNLLIRQGSRVRDARIEHMLRNQTGVRPHKP
jgi:hypothetical protein